MSRKIVPRLKSVSGLISKATLTYPKIATIAGRMLTPARPKVDPSVVEPSPSSRAHLTARSPHSLPQSLAGIAKQEERPLPQHEPDPFALMVPLRTGNPATWLVQHEMLNGWRQPFHLTQDSEQKRITQRISNLLGLDSMVFVDSSAEDCEEDHEKGCNSSCSSINIQQRNVRLEEEDRQEAKKNLDPPRYPQIQEETPYRPCSTDSATFLVTSRCLNKSPSFPRLQEAPRSTNCSYFTPNGDLNRQQFQVYPLRYMPKPFNDSSNAPSSLNTRKRLDNHVTTNPQHPINIVRPDIPPLNSRTTPQVSEKVLRLERAREYHMELSEREHKSRHYDWVAWIKRRMHF